MARRAWLVAAGVFVWLAIPAVPASAGGGGCISGMTQGGGDTVVITEGCFTPGILQVEPGASVAFSNKDPYGHNVSANGWGHLDALEQGDGFTAVFDQPGVYPFACTYHPNMTGAIVVGGGTGTGNGTPVTDGRLDTSAEAPTTDAVEPVVATQPTASSPPMAWIGGAIGLAVGVCVGLFARRRGQRTETT